ncbi:WD repeat protein [Arthroderma uncinatum]|uniref:WD repeat protein n=1 Tax=Arthroderma uncinatum TaxID=74035 RepID=UPI00144AF02D|nr:WD repeat protein [Arthroderma uncinatum]KAF3483454.1 WD repeat protein [Arthroderma uncinatum]
MVFLETSQDYLKQSSLLLEAYPDTTRISTRYSYPKRPSAKERAKAKSKATTSESTEPTETTVTPATLTLKTFNPGTGICLKYQTNKAAEVGRLIAGLGKLASGAPIEDLVPQIPGKSPAGETEDVDMLDVPSRTLAPSPVNDEKDGGSRSNTPVAGGAGGGGGGGKSAKGKKKGKGKK